MSDLFCVFFVYQLSMCLLSACPYPQYFRMTAPEKQNDHLHRCSAYQQPSQAGFSQCLLRGTFTILKRVRKSERFTQSSFSKYVQRTEHCCCHSLSRRHCGKLQTQLALCGTSVSSSVAFGTKIEGFPVPKHKYFSLMKNR